SEVEVNESEGVIQTFLNIVPENPFDALTDGNILQVIFFAIFIGLAITIVGKNAEPVYKFFDGLADIMFWITGIIIRLAPIGILGLVVSIIVEYGAAILLPLLKIILAFGIACFLHAFIVYSLSVKPFAQRNTFLFFKG